MAERPVGTPRTQPGTDSHDGDILFEFHQVGNVVKVTAVDPHSLTEVSIVGDPAMGEAALARAALRKLRYVLERRAGKLPGPQGGGRGGTIA